MAYGTVEETTWPVDTDDVEWTLRHAPHRLTDKGRMFAASVMGAYRHLIDPTIHEDSAAAALKRARLVAQEIEEGRREVLESQVMKTHVVIQGEEVFGPFTYNEAIMQRGQMGNGAVVRPIKGVEGE